jgi:signal transduction histidine kinase/CheY-like chemotaxis protein
LLSRGAPRLASRASPRLQPKLVSLINQKKIIKQMKNTGIYARLVLTLVLIAIISLLILLTINFIANKQEKLMFEDSQVQFGNEVKSLIGLKTSVANQVVYDYTFWDDFVEEIYLPDTNWYNNNITTILKSFRLDYVCVYDTSFKLVHEAASDEFGIRGLVSKDVLAKVKEKKFLDFFLATTKGLVHVSCATVHPETDPTHTLTKPEGYLIVAKSWDKGYLEELGMLSSSKVVFSLPDDTVAESSDFTFSVNQILNDWNENAAGYLYFRRTSNSLMLFHDLKDSMIVVLLVSMLVTVLIFGFALRRWVIRPLQLVTSILKSDNPAQIAQLRQAPGEFKHIGNLFGDFFHQRDELKLAKEKAEESDKLKTAFLSNISHEIRTPMNGILGFAALLNTPDLTGSEQEEYIEIIKISGDRMLNIINDIVNISKIETGLIQIDNTEADINDKTAYVYSLLKPQAEEKGLGFACKNGLFASDAIINTDHEKVYIILSNLVKNAIKFSQNGSIEFGYVVKNATANAGAKEDGVLPLFLEFYVKDTGIGIPADRQKAIFDRFVQADISDTRAFQGAGLGLSISKAYVEMLGGIIWVESIEGVGSTFYFTIPYHPAQLENIENTLLEQQLKTVTHRQNLKILIVEDDSTSAAFLNLALKNYGTQIITATTGVEAVEACLQNPETDLIMMDIKLPGMDGLEATREIRQFNAKVVIIAQTANAMINDSEKALEAGCNEYISKPINMELLKRLIQKYFKK